MPFSSHEISGNSLRTKTRSQFPADKGILTALSAINQREIGEFHDNYVRIGIAMAGDSPQNIIIVLAQGYCDGMTALTWSGKLELEPNMELFIDLWSSDSSTINLAYVVEQ